MVNFSLFTIIKKLGFFRVFLGNLEGGGSKQFHSKIKKEPLIEQNRDESEQEEEGDR